jgi:hypothetical protein
VSELLHNPAHLGAVFRSESCVNEMGQVAIPALAELGDIGHFTHELRPSPGFSGARNTAKTFGATKSGAHDMDSIPQRTFHACKNHTQNTA